VNNKDYITYYGANNSEKLRQLSDVIIGKQFPWLPQMHYDDFYSIAGEVLWKCVQRFDYSKGASFETYLIGCLIRKFKTRVTYMNRKSRNNGSTNVSLDALIDEGDACLMNMIASNDTAEPFTYSEKMNLYLDRLSELQKKVLFALADNYSPEEIKKTLNITTTEFSDICTAIRAYRNVSLLY
jgi:DNA-directed RNA polymerase specialized sigma subunit